jgi:hypothetical protein
MFRAVGFDDSAQKRIKDASELEKRLRTEAWLNIPVDIFGYNLRQITIRDLLELEYADNNLLTAREADLSDYIQLVLTLSDKKSGKNLASFVKKLTINLRSNPSFKDELLAFFTITFNDLPSNPRDDSVETVNNVTDSNVWLASLIDAILSEYGWTIDHTLDQPASLVFQLYQRILKRNLGDKYSIKNSLSQQVRADEINKLHKQTKGNN